MKQTTAVVTYLTFMGGGKWTWKTCSRLRPPFNFNIDPKLNIEMDEKATPLQYFEIFFDEPLISVLVSETNNFANQQIVKEGSYTKNKVWEELTDKEVKIFIGLLLLQDVVSLPRQEWYWSKRESIQVPIFSKIMTRDRFRNIMKYWHFGDNICPRMYEVIEYVRAKCSQVLTPKSSIGIDETMHLFKDRLGWKQYVPMKRSHYGMKSYSLFESETGYIWNFFFYLGKNTAFSEEFKNFSRSTKIVLQLMTHLLDKGYCLTLDSSFSSPLLADYFVTRSTDVFGTINPNKKDLPTDLEKRKLLKGEVMAFQRGKVMVLKWQGNKKAICALSTIHDASMKTTKFRRGKDCLKPTLLFDYNNAMGSLDRSSTISENELGEEPSAKQPKKYFKAVFRHLMDICVYNSFIIYKKNTKNTKRSFLEFKMDIIEGLLEDNREAKRQVTHKSLNIARLTERHFISHVPPNKVKKEPCRRCIICCAKKNSEGNKIRKETRFWCEDCKVGLCIDPCFKEYHTKANIDH
ncbi:piggyBac transposable element-derived protein 4 [Lepeophtheirus salmonis]|uniref:piggyBac transposable element-derived protein 4 n=1 Tax=Lepeophtheirus salmonis TaxID=72036 RepID=UPI001AE11056|nr:piggyBac transposable element-derived protein 4-like [Lepeophtheirus salmonis]